MSLVQIRRPLPPTGAAPAGAEPLALSDRLGRRVRYLRVSLTDRCNYRCTYCMPDRRMEYDPRANVLTLEEVVRLVAEFALAGVDRVRLTGGEPTLRRGIVELVDALSSLPVGGGGRLSVTLTTNGERLAEIARPLAEAGLSGITISIDTIDAERFATITRRGTLEHVLAGIREAKAAGLHPIKLNTVAIRGFNDDELAKIAAFAWDHGLVPRFIELMPMASGELFVPGELMAAADVRAAVASALTPGARGGLAPDDGGDVAGAGPATYWRVVDGPYRGRRLGTIAAMTENFCASCNRLRLSATGQLHACLARDDTGDLRAAVRSEDPGALARTVAQVLGTKRDAHGFNMDGSGGPEKAMVSIGG
ncbi:MAG: GTP 3',8-cyclase MoaA [Myxococcota bacterium]